MNEYNLNTILTKFNYIAITCGVSYFQEMDNIYNLFGRYNREYFIVWKHGSFDRTAFELFKIVKKHILTL